MAGSQRAHHRARLLLLLLLLRSACALVAFFYRSAAARLAAAGLGALGHLRPIVGANIRAPIGDIRVVVVVILVIFFLAHRLALGILTRPRRRRRLWRATTAAIRLPLALIGAAAGACRRVSGSALIASLIIIVTPKPQLLRTGHVLLRRRVPKQCLLPTALRERGTHRAVRVRNDARNRRAPCRHERRLLQVAHAQLVAADLGGGAGGVCERHLVQSDELASQPRRAAAAPAELLELQVRLRPRKLGLVSAGARCEPRARAQPRIEWLALKDEGAVSEGL